MKIMAQQKYVNAQTEEERMYLIKQQWNNYPRWYDDVDRYIRDFPIAASYRDYIKGKEYIFLNEAWFQKTTLLIVQCSMVCPYPGNYWAATVGYRQAWKTNPAIYCVYIKDCDDAMLVKEHETYEEALQSFEDLKFLAPLDWGISEFGYRFD
jgi:hypothetical protein